MYYFEKITLAKEYFETSISKFFPARGQDPIEKNGPLIFSTLQCIYIKFFQETFDTLIPTRKDTQNIFREETVRWKQDFQE